MNDYIYITDDSHQCILTYNHSNAFGERIHL